MEVTSSDHSSIQEVWKLLEQGSNISIKSSTSEVVAGKPYKESDLEIFGESIKTRMETGGKMTKKLSTKLPLKKKEKNKTIRNYNQRD